MVPLGGSDMLHLGLFADMIKERKAGKNVDTLYREIPDEKIGTNG